MTDRENCLATLKVARKKAVDCVGNYKFYLVIGQALDFAINDIEKRGSEAPAVDAVEVVRCKDCKHYGTNTVSKLKTCYVHILTPHPMPEDAFCSYGEPRGERKE